MPGTLRLSKRHGAGNDFLVLVDPDGSSPLSAPLARALCHRRTGVGADGLIRVTPGRDGADLVMELRNADGSEAEMSGNGMRCLAQAAAEAGLVDGPTFTVATAGGLRTVELRPSAAPAEGWASVDMGPVALGDEPPPPPGARRARRADVGNPHLVLLVDDPSSVDLPAAGPPAAVPYPGGVNVEFIAPVPGRPGHIDLVVWERGAGATLACGTGSVAAAEVARSWGLAGDTVTVHNPGGALEVALGPAPGDGTRLAGPVAKVADVVVAMPAGS